MSLAAVRHTGYMYIPVPRAVLQTYFNIKSVYTYINAQRCVARDEDELLYYDVYSDKQSHPQCCA